MKGRGLVKRVVKLSRGGRWGQTLTTNKKMLGPLIWGGRTQALSKKRPTSGHTLWGLRCDGLEPIRKRWDKSGFGKTYYAPPLTRKKEKKKNLKAGP